MMVSVSVRLISKNQEINSLKASEKLVRKTVDRASYSAKLAVQVYRMLLQKKEAPDWEVGRSAHTSIKVHDEWALNYHRVWIVYNAFPIFSSLVFLLSFESEDHAFRQVVGV